MQITCENCGIVFNVSPARMRGRRARFCSFDCRRAEKAARPPLTQKRLHELLTYDPSTGEFVWRGREGYHYTLGAPGTVAGWIDPGGYRHIRVDGHLYLAHQLAWLYVHGKWPGTNLDHKDGIENGDDIANLRPCTQSQNIANSRLSIRNKSGFKGVSRRRGGWRATIVKDGKQKYLGHFRTPEEASAAYAAAAREAFGEFARP